MQPAAALTSEATGVGRSSAKAASCTLSSRHLRGLELVSCDDDWISRRAASAGPRVLRRQSKGGGGLELTSCGGGGSAMEEAGDARLVLLRPRVSAFLSRVGCILHPRVSATCPLGG